MYDVWNAQSGSHLSGKDVRNAYVHTRMKHIIPLALVNPYPHYAVVDRDATLVIISSFSSQHKNETIAYSQRNV